MSKFVKINDLLDKKKDFSKVQSDENNNDTTLKEHDLAGKAFVERVKK